MSGTVRILSRAAIPVAAWMALWIPYLSFPLGAALLALQCLAELAAIVSGRESTAGDAADAAGFPD